MNKKKILGIALVAGALAFTFKDKIFGSTGTKQVTTGGGNTNNYPDTGSNTTAGTTSASQYEGSVVRSPGNDEGWYKVVNGKKIVYYSINAYNADGKRPIIDLSYDELQAIPADRSRYINDYGQITNW